MSTRHEFDRPLSTTTVSDAAESRQPQVWPTDRLLAHWKVWAVATLLGAVLGVLMALWIPKSYEATSLVMVTGIRSEAAVVRPLTTIRVLAESRALAEKVLGRFREPLAAYDLTVERFLANHVRVEEVRGTNLLRLHVRLPDATLAHQVCEFLTTSLIEYFAALQQGGTVVMAERSKSQLAAAEKKVEEAQQRLREMRGAVRGELLRKEATPRVSEQAEVVDLLVDIEAQRARVGEEYERAERLLTTEGAVLQVADPASRPERAVWPKPMLFAAMGALIALLASGLVVVLGVFPPR